MAKKRNDKISDASRDLFTKIMRGHSNVTSMEEVNHGEYVLHRTHGDAIHVYLTGKYVFGQLDYLDLRNARREINCIVPASAWNSYTDQAKASAVMDHIGLFTMKELMGALNMPEYWSFVPLAEREGAA